MVNVMTTKMSSKGQIVLPEALRRMYGWGSGTSFAVIAHNGAVIMQPLAAPTDAEIEAEFESAFKEVRRQSAASGLRRSHVLEAIAQVRKARRAGELAR